MSWDKTLADVNGLIESEEIQIKRTVKATTSYIKRWENLRPLLELKSYIEKRMKDSQSDAIKEGIIASRERREAYKQEANAE